MLYYGGSKMLDFLFIVTLLLCFIITLLFEEWCDRQISK